MTDTKLTVDVIINAISKFESDNEMIETTKFILAKNETSLDELVVLAEEATKKRDSLNIPQDSYTLFYCNAIRDAIIEYLDDIFSNTNIKLKGLWR